MPKTDNERIREALLKLVDPLNRRTSTARLAELALLHQSHLAARMEACATTITEAQQVLDDSQQWGSILDPAPPMPPPPPGVPSPGFLIQTLTRRAREMRLLHKRAQAVQKTTDELSAKIEDLEKRTIAFRDTTCTELEDAKVRIRETLMGLAEINQELTTQDLGSTAILGLIGRVAALTQSLAVPDSGE